MQHYGHLFRLLSRSISQMMNNAMAEMELTSAQGRIMGYLALCREPPCPKDVEEKFHLSHPTVSGILARLEKKGFLELRPDPNDRRCKRIVTLEKGLEFNEKIYRTILDNESRIVRGFSDAEQAQFLDYLLRAARNVGVEPHSFPEEEETDE